MKMRIGFVSNSSSTSFCAFGVSVDSSDMDDLLSLMEEGPEKEELAKSIKDGDYYECLETLIANKNLNLSFQRHYDANITYVGREWTSIRDDETGQAFKESVKKDISILFPNKAGSCGCIEESWYNG